MEREQQNEKYSLFRKIFRVFNLTYFEQRKGKNMQVAIFVTKVVLTMCLIYPLLFWLCSTICRFLTFFNIFTMNSKSHIIQSIAAVIRVIFMIHDEPVWDYNPILEESVFKVFEEVINFIFGSVFPLFIHIAILVLIW